MKLWPNFTSSPFLRTYKPPRHQDYKTIIKDYNKNYNKNNYKYKVRAEEYNKIWSTYIVKMHSLQFCIPERSLQ
jgi:hypothetical protein